MIYYCDFLLCVKNTLYFCFAAPLIRQKGPILSQTPTNYCFLYKYSLKPTKKGLLKNFCNETVMSRPFIILFDHRAIVGIGFRCGIGFGSRIDGDIGFFSGFAA